MFKKKKFATIKESSFGSVSPTRASNIRHQESWVQWALVNALDHDNTVDHDKYDEHQHLIFGYEFAAPNNSTILAPTERPLPDGEVEARKFIRTKPLNKQRKQKKEPVDVKKEVPSSPNSKAIPSKNAVTIDVIELSDDEVMDDEIMVVKEVEKTSTLNLDTGKLVRERKYKRNLEKFSNYLKELEWENTTTEEVEIEEKRRDGDFKRELIDYLKDEYLAICNEDESDEEDDVDLSDTSYLTTDEEMLEEYESEEQAENAWIPKKQKSPSPIRVKFSSESDSGDESDDDFPLVSKKVEDKKESPSTMKKPVPIWKNAARTEEEPSIISPIPAGEFIIPKKDTGLKSTNVNDFMRNDEARKEKQRLLKMEKERKEKETAVMTKTTKKGEESATYRIPKKDPPPSIELSEPLKKKIRVDHPPPPEEIPVDILGMIEGKMGPISTRVAEEIDKGIQWDPPRYVKPVFNPPPSVPSRFEMRDEDVDMDISNASLEMSPLPPKDKTSPQSSDEGIEVDRRIGMEVEKRIEETPCARVDDVSPRNGEIFDPRHKDSIGKRTQHEIRRSESLIDQNIGQESRLSTNGARYRLTEIDGIKRFVLVDRPLESLVTTARKIPIADNDSETDPRIPAPSPDTLSKWNSTKFLLNLEGEDTPYQFPKNEKVEDELTKQKKKAVKWGENATKEFNKNDIVDDAVETIVKPMDKKEDKDEMKGREECIRTGSREVGGKKYPIVKKVPLPPCEPAAPKSCLKPSPSPSPTSLNFPSNTGTSTSSSSTSHHSSSHHSIRPPTTPPLNDEDVFMTPIPPAPPQQIRIVVPTTLPASGTTFKLPDFVPPPGFMNGTKIDEEKIEREKEEKEKKEKEEKEKKEKEEKEKKEKEEKEKKEKEEKEKKEKEEKEKKEKEEREKALKSREMGEKNARMNQGASSSFSMGNLNTRKAEISMNAGASVSASSTLMNGGVTSKRSFERGSDIIGLRDEMPAYKISEVKYDLDMRETIMDTLKVHKIIQNYEDNEYSYYSPSYSEQKIEQEKYHNELTSIEKNWKEKGLQPVWLQSLPLKTNFSFGENAGLYWPVVQATDKISENEEHFASIDVLRSLGNNTHFATEKRALVGMEARLPNGMTHKERFDAFYNNTKEKPEGRFTKRRMYSRVFSNQSEEEARIIHTKNMEDQRKRLREHEETIMRNAPEGVTIEYLGGTKDRPAGFRDFPDMIQFYRTDDYDRNEDKPFEASEWYSNHIDFYMPYCDRVNYLCHVINHYNQPFNALYDKPGNECERNDNMESLDIVAFGAAQIALGRMEPCKRVGFNKGDYTALIERKDDRIALLESRAFSLDEYLALSRIHPVEEKFFHNIIDWLHSYFKIIKPISEWDIAGTLDDSFVKVVLYDKSREKEGKTDTRRTFFEEFRSRVQSSPPDRSPSPKRQRCDLG